MVVAREMSHPRDETLTAIWQIKNIERTEVKADAVDVSPISPSSGTYKVTGRFAGVPWNGEFAYELNDGGFHSRNANVPPSEATIEGGFVVTPTADGCTVIHYEQYVLARPLRPLKFLIRAYLRWTMRRELRDLERLVGQKPAPTMAAPQARSESRKLTAVSGNG
jgi:hypothetical protein